ncbi:hypothetical protein [uncultured Aquimarina sp.]|uniref:hypothetical protein n=1 Tax=uncultured Aquimarina sp. TaxID=575652 RepID=UPI00261E6BB8|nr:hypothetical protein [uncultured Aquimarina sp.]
MLKKILNLNGVEKLSSQQKKIIKGSGNPTLPPCGTIRCYVGPFVIDCSLNTDGRCTCVNGTCVEGCDSDCR